MGSVKNSAFKNYFHKNGRAMGSMGYFILLMIVFLIGAPEAWIRPNLHQSVFVMMPTLLFMVIPLVFLVTSGEIDLSFASTYGLSAYVFALLVTAGIDPAIAFIGGVCTGALVGASVGALIVFGRLSSLVASLGVLFLIRGFLLFQLTADLLRFWKLIHIGCIQCLWEKFMVSQFRFFGLWVL